MRIYTVSAARINLLQSHTETIKKPRRNTELNFHSQYLGKWMGMLLFGGMVGDLYNRCPNNSEEEVKGGNRQISRSLLVSKLVSFSVAKQWHSSSMEGTTHPQYVVTESTWLSTEERSFKYRAHLYYKIE